MHRRGKPPLIRRGYHGRRMIGCRDLAAFKNLLASIPATALLRFICGKRSWRTGTPARLSNTCHETQIISASLKNPGTSIPTTISECTLKSCRNCFTSFAHRYIHSSPKQQAKPEHLQQAFYLLQNLYFLRNGKYLNSKRELLACLDGEERRVLQTAIDLKENPEYDFNQAYPLIFTWCQRVLQSQ